MAKDATKIATLGPVTAVWDSQDFGHCRNARVAVSHVKEEAKCDVFEAPVGVVEKGHAVEAKIVIYEVLNMDIWTKVFGGTKVVGTATAGTKVTFGSPGGDPATTGELTLVPIDPAKAGTYDLKIYKAYVVGDPVEVPLQGKEVAAFEVTVRGIIDTSRAEGDMLFAFGNQDAEV